MMHRNKLPLNSRRRRALLLPALLSAALVACTTAPPKPPVPFDVPAQFAESPRWTPLQPLATAPQGAWWQVFNDPVLNELEPRVAAANQTLQAALAAYDQALALTNASRAQFYPTLGAGLSASRFKGGSGSAANNNANNFSTGPGNSVSADLTASWVPDVWGQVRQQVAANAAAAQASAATVRATQLSLQATLAQTYVQLRVTDAQIHLAEQTVADYAKALQQTGNRYRAGVVSAADVAQARTQWLGARVTRSDLEVTRAQQQHALAVLVGVAPSQLQIPASTAVPAVVAIPAGLPAQVLQRRPDVAAAAAKVAEANAQIGVARTAWLPNINLSAQAGVRGTRWADLFNAPNLFWSLGPALTATLFDGGARRAQLASATANYRQTVANYRQSVLTAFQQTEDNLVAQRVLADEAALQRQTVEAAASAQRLAENQYRAGTVPYLNVLSAQTTANAARSAELGLLGRRLTASVLLIEALGGAWGDQARPALGSASVGQE